MPKNQSQKILVESVEQYLPELMRVGLVIFFGLVRHQPYFIVGSRLENLVVIGSLEYDILYFFQGLQYALVFPS